MCRRRLGPEFDCEMSLEAQKCRNDVHCSSTFVHGYYEGDLHTISVTGSILNNDTRMYLPDKIQGGGQLMGLQAPGTKIKVCSYEYLLIDVTSEIYYLLTFWMIFLTPKEAHGVPQTLLETCRLISK